MENQAIIKAIEVAGGLAALARAIQRPTAEVWQWKTGRRPVPAARCMAVEDATAGIVTRKELRPKDWHLYWPDLPAPAAHEESRHA